MFDMMEDYIVTGWKRVLDNEMPGREFEEFCVDFLCAAGFWRADLMPASGDGGVDILASKKDVTYVIQCKRQQDPVGPKVVRDIVGGRDLYRRMGYRCDKAVIMTNAGFTERAKESAELLDVLLWSKEEIEKMAEETGVLLL